MAFRKNIERSKNGLIEFLYGLPCAGRITVPRQEGEIIEENASAVSVDALRFRSKAGKVVRK